MIVIDDGLFELKDKSIVDLKYEDMSESARTTYYLMYQYYNSMLYGFLLKNTRLKDFDLSFEKNNLKFLSVKDENKDFYQTLASDLKFIYLRNNLYIHRLTSEELAFIKKRLIKNNLTYDNEVENFIKKTYRKVISEYSGNGQMHNFGPVHLNFFAPVNSLVFGFRNDYYNNGINNDDLWYDNYLKQCDYVTKLSDLLVKDISDKLNCDCSIFEYDENSIKKKLITNLKSH